MVDEIGDKISDEIGDEITPIVKFYRLRLVLE